MDTTSLNSGKRPYRERVRSRLGTLACAAFSLTLTSCATMVDFSSWAVGYNKSVEEARNQLMLLNIIRASENMPLMFTGVQVVRGNGQNTVGGSAGITRSITDTTASGALASTTETNALAPSISLQVSSGFNFDVVVIDSAEFLKGLLTPVSVSTFNHYTQHGIPEELLMHLLVENITISKAGQPTMTYRNNPLGPDYKQFLVALTSLLDYGFTTEISSSSGETIGPLLTDADLKSGRSIEFSKTVPGLVLAKVPGGYRFIRPGGAVANFCFMGEKSNRSRLPETSLCADSPARKARKADAAADSSGNNAVKTVDASMLVRMRSTSEVFKYLGNLAHYQAKSPGNLVKLYSPQATAYPHQGKSNALFRVLKDQSKANDVAVVEYRGAVYSLPGDDQGYSATVLTVLSQLFSLSKSVNSIPSTGTVVVR